MATIPLESVSFRSGAVPDPGVVAVLEESAVKENARAKAARGGGVGLDLETVLSLKARVRRPGRARCAWVDLHVFDDQEDLIQSETVALGCVGEDAEEGEVFGFEGNVYRGTGASPGSVWLAPDARKIQFRVYYEVDGTTFSDGLIHQHELPPDSALTHCGPPSSRGRATQAAASAPAHLWPV
jgi:hypothetical protein